MKSQNNDVIMICKQHYNEQRYPSILEALREYYKQEYLMEDKYATNVNILNVLLMPVAEQYFKPRDWKDTLLDIFTTDYNKVKGFYCPADGTHEEIHDRVFSKILTTITLFKIRKDNGDWLIDLSGYGDGEQIV